MLANIATQQSPYGASVYTSIFKADLTQMECSTIVPLLYAMCIKIQSLLDIVTKQLAPHDSKLPSELKAYLFRNWNIASI